MTKNHDIQQQLAEGYRSEPFPDRAVRERIDDTHRYTCSTSAEVDGKQQVVPAYFTPAAENSSVVVVQFHAITDEPGRPEGAAHGAVASLATGWNILRVGTPGVESSLWSDCTENQANVLNPEQRRSLMRDGTFRLIGRAAANAVRHALVEAGHEHSDVYVHGGSLGAAIACGALGQLIENNVNLRRVILTDPATNEPESVLRKVSQFIASGKYASAYTNVLHPVQRECLESTGEWVRRSLGSRQANIALVAAAAKGMAPEDTRHDIDSIKERGVEILVRVAEHSEFRTKEPAQKFVKTLSATGVDAKFDVMKGTPHAVTMTTRSWTDSLKNW